MARKYQGYLFCLLSVLITIILFHHRGNSNFILQTFLPEQLSGQNAHSVIPVSFVDKTIEWNLYSRHRQGSPKITAINEALGPGVCVIDYDNDGWDDIFLIGGSGNHRQFGRESWWGNPETKNSLWKNINGQYFKNMTGEAGIQTQNWPMGCAAADLNNDGYQDLIISHIGKIQILQNSSSGKFLDVSDTTGFKQTSAWSTSISFTDFNNDGLVDLYITNFVDFSKLNNLFEKHSGFKELTSSLFEPSLYDSQANYLYQNMGNFKFIEVAAKYGVQNKSGRGLFSYWSDLNSDDEVDLIISNAAGSPSKIYINQINKKNSFIDKTENYLLGDATGTSQIISLQSKNTHQVNLLALGTDGTPSKLIGKNISTNTSQDLSWISNIANTSLTNRNFLAAVEHDFNNDGFYDIYATASMLKVDMDSPFNTIPQKDILWLNNGIKFEINESVFQDNTRGIASADFNNDGKIDLLTVSNNGFARLLINETKSQKNWIQVQLNSTEDSVINAKIAINQNNSDMQFLYASQFSFLSQSSATKHIPLLNSSDKISITVHWTSGKKTFFQNIQTNNKIILSKDGSIRHVEQQIDMSTENQLSKISKYSQETQIQILSELLNNSKTFLQFLNTLDGQTEFLNFYRDSTDEIKLLAIKNISNLPKMLALKIIRIAILSGKEQLIISSIEAIETTEYELPLSWAIERFNYFSDDEKCKISSMLYKLLHEEEAAITNKHLYATDLLYWFENENPSVKNCLLEPISELESYRAVLPIFNLLSSENIDDKLEQKAIWALGQSKQQEAISFLLNFLKNNTANASAYAATITSLNKLGYKNALNLLNPLKQDLQTLLEVIYQLKYNSLLKSNFNDKALKDNLEKAPALISFKNTTDDKSLVLMIKLFSALEFEDTSATLIKMLNHPSDLVAEAAAKELLDIKLAYGKTVFDKAMLANKELRNRLFLLLIEKGYYFNVSDYNDFSKQEIIMLNEQVEKHNHKLNINFNSENISSLLMLLNRSSCTAPFLNIRISTTLEPEKIFGELALSQCIVNIEITSKETQNTFTAYFINSQRFDLLLKLSLISLDANSKLAIVRELHNPKLKNQQKLAAFRVLLAFDLNMAIEQYWRISTQLQSIRNDSLLLLSKHALPEKHLNNFLQHVEEISLSKDFYWKIMCNLSSNNHIDIWEKEF